MAKQEFVPGGYQINESLLRQYFIAGYGQVNDTVQSFSDSFTESVSGASSLTATASFTDTTSDSGTAADSLTWAFAEFTDEVISALDTMDAAASFVTSQSESVTAAADVGATGVARQWLIPGSVMLNSEATRQFFIAGHGQANTIGPASAISVIFNDSLSETVTGAAALATTVSTLLAFSEILLSADALAVANSMSFSLGETLAAAQGYSGAPIPRQEFIAGGLQVNETGNRQWIIPGHGQIMEAAPSTVLRFHQNFVAGGYQVNETGTNQYFVPQYGQVNEAAFFPALPGVYAINATSFTDSVTAADSMATGGSFTDTIIENITAFDNPISSYTASSAYASNMYGNIVYGTLGNSVISTPISVTVTFNAPTSDSLIPSMNYQPIYVNRQFFAAGGYEFNGTTNLQFFIAGYGQIIEDAIRVNEGVNVGISLAISESITGADSNTVASTFNAPYTETLVSDFNFTPRFGLYQDFVPGGYQINETGVLQYFIPGQGQANETSPYGILGYGVSVNAVTSFTDTVTAALAYNSTDIFRQNFITGGYQVNETGTNQYFVPQHGQVNESSPYTSIPGAYFTYNTAFIEAITGADSADATATMTDATFDNVFAYDSPVLLQSFSAEYGARMFGNLVYGLVGASVTILPLPVSVIFNTSTSDSVTSADSLTVADSFNFQFTETLVSSFNCTVFDWRRNANRTFLVDDLLTSFISQGVGVKRKIFKTPAELDYLTIDYVNLLDVDTINTSTWLSSSTDMTVGSATFNGSIVQAWVGSGLVFGDYFAINTSVTQGARTFEESVEVMVRAYNYITDLVIGQQHDANVDYSLDWSPRMKGDTIASSTWYASGNDNALGLSFAGTGMANLPASTLVWISGGTTGQGYAVTNRITTSSGRTLEASFKVFIKPNQLY